MGRSHYEQSVGRFGVCALSRPRPRNSRRSRTLVDLQVAGSSTPPWLSPHPGALGPPLRALEVLAVVVSILVLLESFARFALQGVGTPAPLLPTRHLVVKGLYRYVRNPMYLAVVSAILGESMILGSLSL